MRQSLLVVLTGLIAGTGGALITVRMTASHAAPVAAGVSLAPPVSAVSAFSTGAVVPPGWDARYAERLAALEQAVAESRAAGDASTPIANAPPMDVASHEREFQQGARDAIEQQAQRIRDHEREPVDRAWSASQASLLEEKITASSTQSHVTAARVDCRTSSCVARIAFPHPVDALNYLHNGFAPFTEDCRGMRSMPTPPQGEGEYELSVVFMCRQ